MAKYEKVDNGVKITTNPTTLVLGGKEIVIESVFTFIEGESLIQVERNILNEVDVDVTFTEYFTGAFGVHEYQDDMSKVVLGVDDDMMNYEYKDRKIEKENGKNATVIIPDINTVISMYGDNDKMIVKEGIAFSPIYHIELVKTIRKGGVKTWLNLKKAN